MKFQYALAVVLLGRTYARPGATGPLERVQTFSGAYTSTADPDATKTFFEKIKDFGIEHNNEDKWTDIATVLANAGVDGTSLSDIEVDDLTDLGIPRFDAKQLMSLVTELSNDYNGHPFEDPAIMPAGEYEELAAKFRRYNEAFYLGSERRNELMEKGTYTIPHVEIAVCIIVFVLLIQLLQSCMADWYDDFVNDNAFHWMMLVILSIFVLRFGHFLYEFLIVVGVWLFFTMTKCFCGCKDKYCSPDDEDEAPIEEDSDEEDDNTCCGGIFECDLAANQNAVDEKLLESFVSRHQPDKIMKLQESIEMLHKTFQQENDEKGEEDAEIFRNTIRALSSNDAEIVSMRTGRGNSGMDAPPPWMAGLENARPEDMRLFQYLAESRSFEEFFRCPDDARGAARNQRAIKELMDTYPGRGQQYANFTLGPMSYSVLMTRMRGTLFASLIPVVVIVCLYMVALQFVFQRYCFVDAFCIRKFEVVTETLSFWHDYVFWLMAFGILDGSGDMIEKWHDIQECCWAIRKDILNNAVMFGMGCDDEERRYQMYRYLQVLHFYAYVTPNVVIHKDSRPPLIHALAPIINTIFRHSGILTKTEHDVLDEYDPTDRWQVIISWINDMYKQREKEEEDVCPNWDQAPWMVREKIRDLHERMQMIRPFSHMQLLEYIIYAYLLSLPVEGTYVLLHAGPTVIDFQCVDFFFAIIIAGFTSGLMKFQNIADEPFAYGAVDGLKPISLIRDTEAACLLYLRKPWSSKMVDENGKNTLRWDPEEEEEENEEEEEEQQEQGAAAGSQDGLEGSGTHGKKTGRERNSRQGAPTATDDLETIESMSQQTNEDSPLKLQSKRRNPEENRSPEENREVQRGRGRAAESEEYSKGSRDYDNARDGEGVVDRGSRERRRDERGPPPPAVDRPRKERRQQAVELQPRQDQQQQPRQDPRSAPTEDQPERRRGRDRYDRERRAGQQDYFPEPQDRYEADRREERQRYRASRSPDGRDKSRDSRDRPDRRDRSERRDRERNRRSKKEYVARQEQEWFAGH